MYNSISIIIFNNIRLKCISTKIHKLILTIKYISISTINIKCLMNCFKSCRDASGWFTLLLVTYFYIFFFPTRNSNA